MSAKGSRSKSTAERESPARVLPLPERVVRHHGKALFVPMREWQARGKVPPVLLLTGLEGVGKRSIAHFLSQWILCRKGGLAAGTGAGDESAGSLMMDSLFGAPPASASGTGVSASSDPSPCGECPSCQRAIAGNWLDFTEILPEEDSDTLKIEQFRRLKSTLGFGAHEGPLKVTLIPNADRMTTQAANSLLKLLEEPPAGWAFFLTASDPTLVLPTILSRCQTLRLRPFEPETVRALLIESGIDPERAGICAELGQGSWGKALRLASEEVWEQRAEIFGFLKDPAASLNALVDWATSQPIHLNILLDQLESSLAELIRWTVSPQQSNPEAYRWMNQDGARTLAAHARGVSSKLGGPAAARAFWVERAERVSRARREALAPINRKILTQDVLMPWLSS